MKKFKIKLLFVGMISIFLLPAFPTNIKPIIIGFFGLTILCNIDVQNFNFNIKYFLITTSVYFFLIISLTYSENIDYGLRKLETMSSILVFPFIFSILSKDTILHIRKRRTSYLWIFIIIILGINIAFFFSHLFHYKSAIFVHYITVVRIAQGNFNIHPIYLSMHICIAILFSFFLLKNEKKWNKILILLVSDIILIFFLMMLLKKGPIIGLAITSIVFFFFNKNRKIWSLGLVFLMSLTIAIYNISEGKKKFSELVNIQTIDNGNFSSTNIRYTIYRYAVGVIKETPFFGRGIGDYNDVLINSFKDKASFLYLERYNSHNQFLSFLLSIGFVGSSLFVLTLFYYLKNSLVFDNKIALCVLLFYLIVMTSENILERENGVIFFSFFMGVLPILFNKKTQNK